MARQRPLAGYRRTSPPIIDGGGPVYVQDELARIEAAFADIVFLTPQVATVAPRPLRDGMQRLARAPWRPVSGQTADAWVWWDAATSVWRYLGS